MRKTAKKYKNAVQHKSNGNRNVILRFGINNNRWSISIDEPFCLLHRLFCSLAFIICMPVHNIEVFSFLRCWLTGTVQGDHLLSLGVERSVRAKHAQIMDRQIMRPQTMHIEVNGGIVLSTVLHFAKSLHSLAVKWRGLSII